MDWNTFMAIRFGGNGVRANREPRNCRSMIRSSLGSGIVRGLLLTSMLSFCVGSSQADVTDAQLQQMALDYARTGDTSPIKDKLESELEQQGTDVVLGIADLAGAAFGIPAVGDAVAPYIDFFGGLFSGGGGSGGKDAAIAKAIAKLESRTGDLEKGLSALYSDVGAIAITTTNNENTQRIDAIWGLNGQTAFLGELIGLQKKADAELSSMSVAQKQAFLNNVVEFSTALLPVGFVPVPGIKYYSKSVGLGVGTNIWVWRDVKISRASKFGPRIQLQAPKPSYALALEPYLRTLAFVASVEQRTGLSPDPQHQAIIRQQVAFLIGDDPTANGVPYSLLLTFFPVQCGWTLAHTAPVHYGANDNVDVHCWGNGIDKHQTVNIRVPQQAQLDRYLDKDFGLTDLIDSGQGNAINPVEDAQTYQIIKESGPIAQSIVAAATALGGHLSSAPAAKAPSTPLFDANVKLMASKTLYAVDAAGKMHVFAHTISTVDTWGNKNTSTTAGNAIRNDAKIVRQIPNQPSGIQPASSRDSGVVIAPAPSARRSPFTATAGSNGASVLISKTEAQSPKFNGVSAPAGAPNILTRYQIRNDLVEYDPIPGSWNGFADIIPAQLLSQGMVVYGEKPDGTLIWRRIGNPVLEARNPAGTGWTTLSNVFSGGEGVLYGVNPAGELVWYRNSNVAGGFTTPPSWEMHPHVGVGWGGFTRLFSPGKGIVYAVKGDGTLQWYRHIGYLVGVPSAQAGSWTAPKQVGTGWNGFVKVFAAPQGFIYAINAKGELWFYNHTGWDTGETKWEAPVKLADGWDKYRIVFPAMGGAEPDGTAPILVK